MLLRQFIDGVEKLITFASQTQAPAEHCCICPSRQGSLSNKFWTQSVFGRKVFGRKAFVIYSDLKPLMCLFSATKPIPIMASA